MLTLEEFEETIDEDEEILKVDGFDDCIVGTVSRCTSNTILCYDVQKMITKMMERDGMSYEDAREYYEFNILGAWVGEGTPMFLERFEGGADGEEGEAAASG